MIYSGFSQIFFVNLEKNLTLKSNCNKVQTGEMYFTIWKHTQKDNIPYKMCVNGLREVMCLMAQNFGLVVLLVGPTEHEYDYGNKNFKFFLLSNKYIVSKEKIFSEYSIQLGCVCPIFHTEPTFINVELQEGKSIEHILFDQYSAEHEANTDEDYEANADEADAEEEAEADSEVETPEADSEEDDAEESTPASPQSAFNKARKFQKWHDVSSTETGSDDEFEDYTDKTVRRLLLEEYQQKVISETLEVSDKNIVSEILRICNQKSLSRDQMKQQILEQMNLFVR